MRIPPITSVPKQNSLPNKRGSGSLSFHDDDPFPYTATTPLIELAQQPLSQSEEELGSEWVDLYV